MNRIKVLKLIRLFFVLFMLSGIGSIIDFYLGIFPLMFTNVTAAYDIIRLGHVSVKMPGVPYILAILTILIFLYLIRRLYRLIAAEIKKED